MTTIDKNTQFDQNSVFIRDNLRSYDEPRPNSLFYRGKRNLSTIKSKRPALDDLLRDIQYGRANDDEQSDSMFFKKPDETKQTNTGYNFGMWEGVFIRCLLNIWGVMMFLRLSWVVGNAGILGGSLVVLASTVVTTLTTLSLSAICTNGKVEAGGAYYMISRALGPEFGGAIGLTFYVANSISVALYLLGFAESISIIQDGEFLVSRAWDMRIFGLISLVVLMGVALVGAEFEIKAQKFLLVALSAAILSYFIGTILIDPADEVGTTENGYYGNGLREITWESFKDNWGPGYDDGENFQSVFGVFFPAVTGIMAGANISGDLKDPAYAIPVGTMLAIVLATIVYVIMACLLGASFDRDALKDYETQIAVVEISVWAPLVYAGIFAATLSSALAQLIGAPRILQALARDGLFPFLNGFKKAYGPNDEPLRGYVVTFIIAAIAIMGGDLNAVSPIITNFFLLAYALINYSCCAATWGKSPGWRPSYQYYNPWLALLGVGICFGVMLMVDWIAAGMTIFVCFALYKYIELSKPDVNWGSAGEAHHHLTTLQNLYKLESAKEHVKNYRPQYLLLAEDVEKRNELLRFVSQLNNKLGVIVIGRVLVGDMKDRLQDQMEAVRQRIYINKKISGLIDVVMAPDLKTGAESLFQLGGLGRIRPNTVILGYKNNWFNNSDEEIEEYVGILRSALCLGKAVGVIRNIEKFEQKLIGGAHLSVRRSGKSNKLKVFKSLFFKYDEDYHDDNDDDDDDYASDESSDSDKDEIKENEKENEDDNENNNIELVDIKLSNDNNKKTKDSKGRKSIIMDQIRQEKNELENIENGKKKISEIMAPSNTLSKKAKKKTIDVWWLVADGGLTLLLPYLLQQNQVWKHCKLRVLTVSKPGELTQEQIRMNRLLRKFRIQAEIVVVDKGPDEPTKKTIHEFQAMTDSIQDDSNKTKYFLRLSELLHKHSRKAELIVVSLPVPRYNIPTRRYMSYLEILSKNLPPVFLLRGNQESVLTFYS